MGLIHCRQANEGSPYPGRAQLSTTPSNLFAILQENHIPSLRYAGLVKIAWDDSAS